MSRHPLMPADTPDYMAPAWASCISWASKQPATDPLGRMIDEASGAERAFMEAFIRWVNENVWGPIDGGATEEGAGDG